MGNRRVRARQRDLATFFTMDKLDLFPMIVVRVIGQIYKCKTGGGGGGEEVDNCQGHTQKNQEKEKG